MYCTNCTSGYAPTYAPITQFPPTVNPNLPQPCQPGTTHSLPPTPSNAPASLPYVYVNNLPKNYGFQGPNGSVVAGMTPLSSVPEQSLWNAPQRCPQTQSQDKTNVEEFDNYIADLSVTNPYTGRTLPTLAALLEPRNIQFIRDSIGNALSKEFGFPVEIQDTPAFRQTINDVANENPRWMYDVSRGLPLLNNVIMNREWSVHKVALNQQLFYQKNFLEGNNPKYMPYGVMDHTVKGETVNDASSYSLNQPVPIAYNCFLAQAGLRC
jgi:hypothetical protein